MNCFPLKILGCILDFHVVRSCKVSWQKWRILMADNCFFFWHWLRMKYTTLCINKKMLTRKSWFKGNKIQRSEVRGHLGHLCHDDIAQDDRYPHDGYLRMCHIFVIYLLKARGQRYQIWYPHVSNGKYKNTEIYKQIQKYKVLQGPNICYIL